MVRTSQLGELGYESVIELMVKDPSMRLSRESSQQLSLYCQEVESDKYRRYSEGLQALYPHDCSEQVCEFCMISS